MSKIVRLTEGDLTRIVERVIGENKSNRTMKRRTGIITKYGDVETEDGKLFSLEVRGTDDEGFPKVLIDAKSVGGSGSFKSQSIKPFIGMKVKFVTVDDVHGYNYEIIG